MSQGSLRFYARHRSGNPVASAHQNQTEANRQMFDRMAYYGEVDTNGLVLQGGSRTGGRKPSQKHRPIKQGVPYPYDAETRNGKNFQSGKRKVTSVWQDKTVKSEKDSIFHREIPERLLKANDPYGSYDLTYARPSDKFFGTNPKKTGFPTWWANGDFRRIAV